MQQPQRQRQLLLTVCWLTAAGAQPIKQLIGPPGYHAWPRTVQSQDISGPIGVVDSDTNLTVWHIFIDCTVNEASWGSLAWCHMYSDNLVEWTEAPLAMQRGARGAPDATGLDTGSVFQHPNGTIYAVYEACNQTTNYSAGIATEGDICYARATDSTLIAWDKLCYSPDSARTGGRIQNPTCDWCREKCPARCNAGPKPSSRGQSPFPDIMELQGFRDPVAPWLHPCNVSTQELCWWQPVASGGLSPRGQRPGQPTLLMYKNTLDMAGPWEFAVPGDQVNSSTVWWGNGHPGHTLSCPDIFQPPQPTPSRGGLPLTVFTSLYDNYVLGTLDPASQLLEVIPPFSHTKALPMSGPDLSIMKSGGVGPSNVNSGSRRLYFGTLGLPPGCGIPVVDGVHGLADKGYNHSGFITSLPRDLTIAQVHSPGTAQDAGYRMLNQFAPELQRLRIVESLSHQTGVAPNTTIASNGNSSRMLEILAVFGAHCLKAAAPRPFGVQVLGGALRVGTNSPGVASEADLAALNADGSVLVHVYTDGSFVEGSVGNQSIVLLSSAATATNTASIFGCVATSVDVWSLRNVTTGRLNHRSQSTRRGGSN